ncbi:TatD family hydrolase [Sansalvadorimonas sp. 2012CJ34-2]|uniref:TatD family hydrolase n=1 Tax=Parendozoicomonas callyspongiae TaxID=2942213 RepID=A0ABT0PBK4_9GAMM|nr:TatD family hydrolase [Sansalvadorimonas sp. 2012CJ34-2]MCL6268764.1 TatD family hydrolase [Sansalvadorimonas sp. 2012CJ34-2]
MFVDSHCHLDRIDLEPYGSDLSAAIAAAREAGVDSMLSVSVDMETFPSVLETAAHDNVWASVGVHPLEDKARETTVDELIKLSSHEKVVAIGETGLDYYYAQDRKQQMTERFITHLQAASQTKLPVIIHTRDAGQDTLQLLEQHADRDSAGVIHCFTETLDFAKAALDLDFYISFSGIVTFRNAESLREVARYVPMDRILIETDSPYLAPVPHRGKSNEPKYVADVGRFLAELKGVAVDEFAEATSANFYRLFSKADT